MTRIRKTLAATAVALAAVLVVGASAPAGTGATVSARPSVCC